MMQCQPFIYTEGYLFLRLKLLWHIIWIWQNAIKFYIEIIVFSVACRNIVIAWIVTVPLTAAISALIMVVLRASFLWAPWMGCLFGGLWIGGLPFVGLFQLGCLFFVSWPTKNETFEWSEPPISRFLIRIWKITSGAYH